MCNLSKGVEEKEFKKEFFFQLETLWKQWGGR